MKKDLLKLYLSKKEIYGFTQAFIARKMNLSRNTISCFERGLRDLGAASSNKLEDYLNSL